MLLLLLDLHIVQHFIPNSTVAPSQHVSISKTFFFLNFKHILFQTFLGPLPLPLGLLPLIFEFPYSRYISHIFSQLSTSIITSFFTVLPNGLTQTSYVLLTLHPGDAQPVGPTHTWPTTRPTTLLQAVEPNLHRHPFTTTLLLL